MLPYILDNRLDKIKHNFAMKVVSSCFRKEMAKLPLNESIRSEAMQHVRSYCTPYKKKFEKELEEELGDNRNALFGRIDDPAKLQLVKELDALKKHHYDLKEIDAINKAEFRADMDSHWSEFMNILAKYEKLETEQETEEKKQSIDNILKAIGFENALNISKGLEKKAGFYLTFGFPKIWIEMKELAGKLFPKDEI